MPQLISVLRILRSCRRVIILGLTVGMLLSLYWWAQPLSPQATWKVGSGWARFTPKGTLLYGVDIAAEEGPNFGVDGGPGWQFGGPVGPIRFWDPVSGKQQLRVLTAKDGIACAAISADERWLATVDEPGNVAIWELPNGKVWARPSTTMSGGQVRFSPDSRLLAFSSSASVVVWDVLESKPQHEIAGAQWPYHFSADGKILVASMGNDAVLWSLPEEKELMRFNGSGLIGASAISPDQRLLVTAHRVGILDQKVTIRIWEAATGQPCADVPSLAELVRPRIDFSRDGRLLTIRYAVLEQIWDVSQRPPVLLDTGCECDELQSGVKFSSDGRWLATPKDGTIAVCSVAPFAKHRVLKTRSFLCSPRISPNGQMLVSEQAHDPFDDSETFVDWLRRKLSLPAARTQSSVRMFDVETGTDLGAIPGEWWADFSPDGKAFFTALHTDDPRIQIVQRWECPPVKSPIPMLATTIAFALLLLVICVGRVTRASV